MFKTLKQKIEEKRGARNLFWKTLVFSKDFVWKILTFVQSLIRKTVALSRNFIKSFKLKYQSVFRVLKLRKVNP